MYLHCGKNKCIKANELRYIDIIYIRLSMSKDLILKGLLVVLDRIESIELVGLK